MRGHVVTIAIAGLLLAPRTDGETQVVLRGAATPLEAPVESVDRAGVRVGGSEARVIGWDSVKIVVGDLAADAERFGELADDAWRARLRLSRGDLAMAEPLFESLQTELLDAPGPTALMVNEGLLRCRLRRGDQAGAMEPWLQAVAMREAGHRVAGDPPLMAVLDQDLLLPAALPPIWLGDGATASVLTQSTLPPPEGEGASNLAVAMRSMYLAAAQFEIDGSPAGDIPPINHSGGMFVRDIVLSRAGDEDQRRRARESLEAGLDDLHGWQEAWRRAALGRSLLRESDRELRVRGVLQLLHLPARFGSSQPYLTGLALAEASVELELMGDREGAATLRAVLERTDPHHPALPWLDRQRSGPSTTPRPSPAEQD